MACRGGRTGTTPVRQSVALAGCGSTAGLGRCRRHRCSLVGPAGGSVVSAALEQRERSCLVQRFNAPRTRRRLGSSRAVSTGQGVTVQAMKGKPQPLEKDYWAQPYKLFS